MVGRVQTSEINNSADIKWCSAKELINLFKEEKKMLREQSLFKRSEEVVE